MKAEVKKTNLQIQQTVSSYMELKVRLAQLEREKKRMEAEIIKMVGEGNKVQVGEHQLTVRRSATTTSNSWKDAFELALTKVNDATKVVLENAVETTQKTLKRKASISITHKPQ